MAIGQRRKRVVLERPVEAPDSYGQLVQAWATVGTFWAFVRTPSGREAIVAQQFKATLTHIVEIRYLGSTPIGPQMRLLYGPRILNILDVLNVEERNRRYDLHCVEVPPTATPTYPQAGGG